MVIVDDSRTSQLILEAAFQAHGGFDVVGMASDAAAGYTMVRRLGPDLVTIDLCMPYIDGSALLDMLAPLTATCKIVVSDLAATNIAMAAKLKALGATLCLGKQDLVHRPEAFFKNMVKACEALEAKSWVSGPLLTLTSDGRTRGGSRSSRQPVHFGIPIPVDEEARLAELQRRRLDNAVREREFDLVTRFVAEETGFPVCLLTFIDKDTQWIKSSFGFDVTSGPRSDAFCNYTIAGGRLFVVGNAETDPRFANNPMVTGAPGFRTYVGQPIVSGDGIQLGALCVLDTKVRPVPSSMTRKLASLTEILGSMIDRRPVLAA
ncbi:response regulator [Sphingomonas sp. CROZ-RG-20F-R02-07]|uniref:response regulator n=1 Tax=Sphingomonas sp. CROZ-RG-20F-R02-07 TaxID=2914832 RepID=UPI001F58EB54